VPFNEKAREALELGKQHLGVDNGYLTRIDQETNHWEIVVTTDIEDGQASPGLELELQNTYCRETIENDTPHSHSTMHRTRAGAMTRPSKKRGAYLSRYPTYY